MDPDRTHQLAVDVDAEAVDIGQVVELVADDLLVVGGHERLAAISLVAQPVDGVELVPRWYAPVFYPVEQIQ